MPSNISTMVYIVIVDRQILLRFQESTETQQFSLGKEEKGGGGATGLFFCYEVCQSKSLDRFKVVQLTSFGMTNKNSVIILT